MPEPDVDLFSRHKDVVSWLPLLLLLLLCPASESRSQSQAKAAVSGTVVSAPGSKPLSGVTVRLLDSSGAIVSESVTGNGGRFLLPPCGAGKYQVHVLEKGFKEFSQFISLAAGEQAAMLIGLEIKSRADTVEVTDQSTGKALVSAMPLEHLSSRILDIAPVKGDNYQALLPLLPGVVRGPDGRINIKGASAVQSALMVSSSSANDPSTGNTGFELPADAIESVNVLPNPYQAEYGRFSSGITQIQTRRGESHWGFLINNFLPRYKWRDGSIMGIEHYTPRISFSGPLVRDRIFLAQSFQYRIIKTPVPGLSALERDQSLESFDSFTRLDTSIGQRHMLVATFAIFPRKLDYTNLNTFNPKEVTHNHHTRGVHVGLQETFVFGSTALLETGWSYRSYDTDVFGQGDQPMRIYPTGNRGNFFNRQARRTDTIQWTEAYSRQLRNSLGAHIFKAGLDFITSGMEGSSTSSPVEIYRADRSLHTKIEYSGNTQQKIRGNNAGAYLQDHWRIGDRCALELGIRVDRDAIPSRINLAPRAGFIISILSKGRAVLRGGAGRFFDQTPLNAGVFEDYENNTWSRFASDGVTLDGPRVTWHHRTAKDLVSPRSFIWNLEYDQQIAPNWLARVNYMRRRGRHEYLIEPELSDAGSEYVLNSTGRSRYWEVEATLRYARPNNMEMTWSYVRSRSETDLNGYDLFFGNFQNPIINANEYSLAPVDAPNRFLFRAVLPAPFKLTFSPIIEIHDGFPYSAIDENQNFIGHRNRAGRFPTVATLDLRVVRAYKFWKWNMEIGARVYHLLNSFMPRDVQNNVNASDYGTFYNSIPRNWGFTLQFKK